MTVKDIEIHNEYEGSNRRRALGFGKLTERFTRAGNDSFLNDEAAYMGGRANEYSLRNTS